MTKNHHTNGHDDAWFQRMQCTKNKLLGQNICLLSNGHIPRKDSNHSSHTQPSHSTLVELHTERKILQKSCPILRPSQHGWKRRSLSHSKLSIHHRLDRAHSHCTWHLHPGPLSSHLTHSRSR